MNYTHNTLKPCKSYFAFDEYIPITIKFNNSEYDKHIGFYFNDTDLAEFCLDPDNFIINKFILTFSNHFEFLDEEINIPFSENGEITLFCNNSQCSDFKVSVYSNGVHIKLSKESSANYISSGQITLGLDSNNTISEVYIGILNKKEIDFIKTELELG